MICNYVWRQIITMLFVPKSYDWRSIPRILSIDRCVICGSLVLCHSLFILARNLYRIVTYALLTPHPWIMWSRLSWSISLTSNDPLFLCVAFASLAVLCFTTFLSLNFILLRVRDFLEWKMRWRIQSKKQSLRACEKDVTNMIVLSNCNPIMLRLAWSDAGNWNSFSAVCAAHGHL